MNEVSFQKINFTENLKRNWRGAIARGKYDQTGNEYYRNG